MKIGDRLKVISTVNKRIKTSVGTIVRIEPHSVMIVRKNKYGDKIKESFSIGDLMDKYKKKYINSNGTWELVKFEQRGNKIVQIKVINGDSTNSINKQ